MCENCVVTITLPAMFDHLEDRLSCKENQFKMFGPPKKTSCPLTENFIETLYQPASQLENFNYIITNTHAGKQKLMIECSEVTVTSRMNKQIQSVVKYLFNLTSINR